MAPQSVQKSNKIDVILAGQETIGSAERSCDKDEMREMFYTISDGQYKDILYREFSKERVNKELEDFFLQEKRGKSGFVYAWELTDEAFESKRWNFKVFRKHSI